MTAGRGWIAIALVIFAAWTPQRALVGAYLFGGIEGLQLRLQTAGVGVSYHLMQMMPYIATILHSSLFRSGKIPTEDRRA